jgi:hypothetical protein
LVTEALVTEALLAGAFAAEPFADVFATADFTFAAFDVDFAAAFAVVFPALLAPAVFAFVLAIALFEGFDFASFSRLSLDRDARELVFEVRRDAVADFRDSRAALFERVVLLGTASAWNRHAPVLGLFPGNPAFVAPRGVKS